MSVNLENEVVLTPENQLLLSIISLAAEELLIKVNKSKAFHGKKKPQKTKIEGNFLNLVKGIHKTHI